MKESVRCVHLGLLLKSVTVRQLVGSQDRNIHSVHYDSRRVTPGGIFVAIPGQRSDGYAYIEEAVEKGAVAVITEKEWSGPPDVTAVQVEDARLALAAAASAFYGEPFRELCMIGITGTNGKTTTAYLVESILTTGGHKAGVLGTINYRFGGQCFASPVTTPESADLMKLLRQMVDHGVSHAVLEVSSHALDLHRVAFCEFDVGVFTNLSQDHLDYHKDMETYWQCKRELFVSRLGRGPKEAGAAAVINWDDPRGRALYNDLTLQRLRFGLSSACEIQARDTHLGLRGVAGRIRTPHDDFEFTSPLVGNHNIYNILSATGVAVALGVPVENIQRGIADLAGVPGRLEQVQNESGISVFVDYAHTPDALDNVLRVLKSLTSGRLITVFGCGGDRDRQKRAMMGAVAGRISDLSVLTSDNPRTESPEAILADIVRGTAEVQPKEYATDELGNGFSGRGYVMEPDRRKAIGLGLAVAGPGDTVLVAGKGHEPYQILGETTIPFDDKVEVMAALGVLNATANQR
jgi:UDP-N-acetylmuramoyl-L-alanyl-D-glutamate--2,6-diaminopimelate ligase